MQKIIDLAVLAAVLAAVGATALASQQGAQLHDSQYPDVDIAHGAGLYAARCAPCHGAQGDAVGGVNLRSGKFRNAITDRDLAGFIRVGSQAAGMPPFALDDTDMAGIIAYLRNMNSFDAATVKTGNVARGREVFEGKGSCTKCHRVGRVGSHVGPNLTDIGSVRSAGSIQRSLLEPTSQMMPVNRPVRLVTKDGTVINGRRLNEDTYSIQVMDERERIQSFLKSDLREYTIVKTSPMPSYKGTLSSEELSDLLGYLLSLKGPS
ncbi:MAG TPA: c-type cytochrome [Vicinamibacterales bacterium]|jgi:putative heme-binding domain-containing protein|nr:c-type cytochrome [Vicinamibacterales bacterium]